ncbi:MAG: septal ring lytic transglycosylase RlpA family protein [Sphingobacteriia bacterium]|nr:MAG: septal ring lytic transglycosylase RlpA family protein [Sphingobacteriia bacterium]
MINFFWVLISILISSSTLAQADTIQHTIKKDTVLLPIDTTVVTSIDSVKLADSLLLTGKVVKGIASFYSANLDGTKTATGEIFRNNKLTGASNNLKLNTWVKVTNLKNGKTVVVRINDRMHPSMKKKGRVIDLSRSAAKKLDFMEAGLTKVKLEVIEPPINKGNIKR